MNHFPLWIRDALPISFLSGIMFSFGRLYRDNEITAIKSSGINLYSIITPILIIGLILSIFSIFLNIKLVPETYVKVRYIREYQLKGIKPFTPNQFQFLTYSASNGEKFTIDYYDYNKKIMYNVTIDYLSPNFVLIKQIKSKTMEWKENKWIINDGIERIFDPQSKELVSEKKFKTKIVNIPDKPEDFQPSITNCVEMNLFQLEQEIQRLKKHGMNFRKELVEWHFRFAYSFTNFIIAFFGIAFSLGLAGRYSRIRHIVYVILISTIYWLFLSFSKTFSLAQVIPAFWGVWSGNILFLFIGIILFLHIRR
jgi:lipopolysaccharide export system permease protein